MIYVAYLIFGFLLLQLVISFVNLILKPDLRKTVSDFNGLVSVLIPARNEEKNILNLIVDLQRQNYNQLEIIVFDDQSTDRTAELVKEIAQFDKRIKLIQSAGLPDGWLGKNYACNQLALQAKGDYLLFMDADVKPGENIVGTALKYIRDSKSSLVSIFPKQIMYNVGEKAVVPVMNYILLTLLPLPLVRFSGFSSLSAANGQFMLFETETYKKLLPHEKMKAEKVEDIKIVRYYKKLKLPAACLTGSNEISCRMYNNYAESINGFSKNLVMFFGNSYFAAIFFWLITTFGFLVVWFELPVIYFYLLNVMAVLIRIFVSMASNQKIVMNLIYLIPQQMNIGVIIVKSILSNTRGNYEWKGRKIK